MACEIAAAGDAERIAPPGGVEATVLEAKVMSLCTRRVGITAALVQLVLTGGVSAQGVNITFGSSPAPPAGVIVQPAPPSSVIVAPPQPGSVVVSPGASAGGSTVVVPPGGSTVVVPAPQMVQAEEIEADEVRAQTIYANRIEAGEVRGTVHQTGRIEVDNGRGEIRAPSVVASVIYAESIKAKRVTADHIYVRDLDRD